MLRASATHDVSITNFDRLPRLASVLASGSAFTSASSTLLRSSFMDVFLLNACFTILMFALILTLDL